MKISFALALITVVAASPAFAGPNAHIRSPAPSAAAFSRPDTSGMDPLTTGSLGGDAISDSGVRDAVGRDLRSSTRGNAQFPEREPEAQNLGGTAGGPRY
jgi:hypothetical protein